MASTQRETARANILDKLNAELALLLDAETIKEGIIIDQEVEIARIEALLEVEKGKVLAEQAKAGTLKATVERAKADAEDAKNKLAEAKAELQTMHNNAAPQRELLAELKKTNTAKLTPIVNQEPAIARIEATLKTLATQTNKDPQPMVFDVVRDSADMIRQVILKE